ncbi:MAG: 50S ribosomal protein L30 [Cytophagales bacterium]|nr:50S ribosomal protein L30 [Cytophagales bacterium]MDW8385246.1 50S ribosomal protein L30 [Flammeovirgaceae bacterium]
MAKVKVTQVKSIIKVPKTQKLTIKALGLGRIGKSKEFELTPAIKGALEKVSHLIKVEEINS